LKKIVIILLFTFANAFFAFGQDIHFSQFNSSPLNINPAFTGLFKGNVRFVGNYRNQWSAVTVPYTTSSAACDFSIKTNKQTQDILGLGVLVNADKAGDSEYGTVEFIPSISYTKSLRRRGDLFLSYGIQAGLAQRSINYAKLTFDNQYNGSTFDQNISSGEVFSKQSFFFFDLSSGINFNVLKDRYNLSIGGAINHINKPNQSILEGNVPLDQRITLHASAQISIHEHIDVLPGILFLSQGRFKEYTIGSNFKFIFQARDVATQAFYLGGFFRLKDKDAFIISSRIDYNKLSMGLSYDINLSKLSNASNGKGAVELSLIYIIENQKTISFRKIPCPTFM
jgi:type IX secretion system PorP/SprF family membrane protein